MVRKTAKRITQMCVGTAIVCFLIGTGNIIFGARKWAEYKGILEGAMVEMNQKSAAGDRQHPRKSAAFLPGPNLDKQAQYVVRIQQRMAFYEIVMNGGKFLLGVAAVLALGALLLRRRRRLLVWKGKQRV